MCIEAQKIKPKKKEFIKITSAVKTARTCDESGSSTPKVGSSFSSFSQLDDSTRTTDSSFYRRGNTEKTIEKILYNVFIAPLFATISTISMLIFYVAHIFTASIAAFLMTMYFSNHNFSNATKFNLSIIFSSCAVMIMSKVMRPVGSTSLAWCTGLSNFMTALFLWNLNFTTFWICILSSLSASIAAIIYWLFLEPEQRSVVILAIDSYSKAARPMKKGTPK
uniref:Uncharacterized protein n=2 Tax=Acrobeloides nanus TaxID=290746 RepID=A0A914DJY6_9BILA